MLFLRTSKLELELKQNLSKVLCFAGSVAITTSLHLAIIHVKRKQAAFVVVVVVVG